VKLPEMKTGLTISALVHAALLLWGLISFTARPLEAAPTDALPVDIISDTQFSELAKGVKNAPQRAEPKPLVEKIDTPNPVDDASAKVSEKKEIKVAKAEPEPPPPMPEPKPAEAKPEKKEPPKVDPIAETLKKEDAKKKAEEKAKAKEAKRKPDKPETKFDPNQIAALLDKRDPQRHAATGEAPISTPSLGFANGPAVRLSQTELDALRRRLVECWNPPVGAADGAKLKVVLRVLFKPDGSVAAPPVLVAGTPSAYGPAMAESAKRAILTCQPFTMLKPEHYQQWKDIEITFDPRDMFGGG
jgi:outer membrane biosynthesis protein TonB